MRSVLNLHRLKHFVAAAEAGSLRAAALREHLSQPALSKSIAKLEEELEMRLFDRTSGLVLTALGQQALERVRRLVNAASDLERELLMLRGAEIGELRIGCGPILAECLLGRAVSALQMARPRVRVEAQVGRVDEFVGALRERRLDFIVGDLKSVLYPADIETIPFPEIEIVWFCRPGHPLVGRAGIRPDELFRYPLVLPSLPVWGQQWLERVLPLELRPLRAVFECSHYPSLVSVVASGDSVCASTSLSVADDLAAGRVALLDVAGPHLSLRSGVMYLRTRSLSRPGELLIQEMVRLMGELSGRVESGGRGTGPPRAERGQGQRKQGPGDGARSG